MAVVKWVDGLSFVGIGDSGHALVMDAPKEAGGEGSGFRPAELLLVALGGCTAMDVLTILRKERQAVTDLAVNVSGRRREEEPRYYESIHVEYVIRGKGISEQAAERAIRLSRERYCSVWAMLEPKAKMYSSYKLIEEP